MRVSVRYAEGAADRDAVFHLRRQIYNEELGRGRALDAEGRMIDDLDGTARLLVAETSEGIVGTVRINWGADGPFGASDRNIYSLDALEAVVPPEQILVFSRFAVLPVHRGSDLPGLLIDAMVRSAVGWGVSIILCDCRPELINLYLRLGMRVCGPVVTTPGAGILVPLALLLDDAPHAAATGSRISPLLAALTPDPARRGALLALLPAEPAVLALDHSHDAPRWTSIVEALADASPDSFPIFNGLPAASIARLITRANVIACSAGDIILHQHTQDTMVFVVLEGSVDVVRDGRVVARLQPGSVFGEIAFLAGVRRTADIVAATECRVVGLRPSTINALISRDPELAAPFLLNLSRILARRLADASTPDARPLPTRAELVA